METIHPQILWVVGQRVSVVPVTKSYSLAETLAPARRTTFTKTVPNSFTCSKASRKS
jgi:hypothetical protein